MAAQPHIDNGPFGWTQHPDSIFNDEKMHKDAYGTEQGRYDRGMVHRSRKPHDSREIYVALLYDPTTGKIIKRSSSFLKQFRDEIFAEAVPRFKSIVQSNLGSMPPFESRHISTDTSISHERASFGEDMKDPQYNPSQLTPPSSQTRKRRRSAFDQSNSDRKTLQYASDIEHVEDIPEEPSIGQVTYPAAARADWEKWFGAAFRAVQQVSCRVIAKEWIKTIHPKKQSTHPYNGKNTKTGNRGDPDSTKPPYWPKDVIHKEPDHIVKDARTKLLVHLLMSTPHQEMSITGDLKANTEITAITLRDALEQKKHDRSMADLQKKFHIIDQIINIRTRLEQYEQGGLNESTMITAPDYSDYNRGSRNDDDDDLACESQQARKSRKSNEESSENEEEEGSRATTPMLPSNNNSPANLSRPDTRSRHRQEVQMAARQRRSLADHARQVPLEHVMYARHADHPMPMQQAMDVDEMTPTMVKHDPNGVLRPQISSPCEEMSVGPPYMSREMQMQIAQGRMGMTPVYAGARFVPQTPMCGMDQPGYSAEMMPFAGYPGQGPFIPGAIDPRFGYVPDQGHFPVYEQRQMSSDEMMQRAFF